MSGKDLVELRENIVKTMKKLKKKLLTTQEITDCMLNDKLIDKSVTKEQVGNNLRVLKNSGVVSEEKDGGKRCWSLTGKKFDNDHIVRMVIAFPGKVHAAMSKKAKGTCTKTALVIEAVRKFCE